MGALTIVVSALTLYSALPGGAKRNEDSYTQGARRSLVEGLGTPPHRKKLALVRPFSTHDGEKMLESFTSWDNLLPCNAIDDVYDVDLVLSYSRRFDDGDAEPASRVVSAIQDKIADSGEDGLAMGSMHWSRCFKGLRVVEADIDVSWLEITFDADISPTITHNVSFLSLI